MLTLSPGPIWMIRGGEFAGGAGSLGLGDCAAHTAKQQTEQISAQSPDFTVTERLDTPKPPKNLKISARSPTGQAGNPIVLFQLGEKISFFGPISEITAMGVTAPGLLSPKRTSPGPAARQPRAPT
jgi:hypothetical protein